jgi:hypothetical protein
MSLSDEQVDLIRENVEGKIKYWSSEKIRELQEKTFISETKFVAYALSSTLTHSKIADLMGYDDSGVISRYVYDVRDRIEKAEKTLEVEEMFDGD